ncbi:MAG: YihY/virulence factor BrkB family protein [Bacteroidota bacterium]|nr:YihY/virulence factor BrkB family protein [Bacteroidota bacterium]
MKLPYHNIFKSIWHLLRETFLEFLDNNSFDRGAALAYYTVFALPPILIIMINSVGSLFGKDEVSGEIYYEIKELIGSQGAYEVQKMVENISRSGELTFTTIIGILTLLLAATGLFISMQDALNVIWGVKAKPRNQYFKMLLDRVMSFAMILSFTFILLVSLIAQAILAKVGNYLMKLLDQTAIILLQMFNEMLSLAVVAFIFAMIFKFLPDAKIQWRDVWVGAIVTAILFTLGRFLIGFYLGNSNYSNVYGAAGTVVIILVWVFYSSQILFFGAVFTLVFSRKYGSNIYPSPYAVRVIRQEVEVGKTAVNAEPGKFENSN